jgi:hypothetical protein
MMAEETWTTILGYVYKNVGELDENIVLLGSGNGVLHIR